LFLFFNFFNLNLGTILQEGYFQHEGNIKFKIKILVSIYIYIKVSLKLFFTIINEEIFDKKMFCYIYKNLVERSKIVVKKMIK
jgi:hypothetical protein